MPSFLKSEHLTDLVTLAVALGLAVVQKLWRSYRMARSQTWPVTYGRTLRSETEDKHGTFGLKIFYTYRVGEESHQSEFQKRFRDEGEAQLWADALREKQIAVHYDPEKPTRSQLWESDLLPIVQSFPPRMTVRRAAPFPVWERLVVVAGAAVAIAGLGLSVIEFIGRLAGKTWLSPTLSGVLAGVGFAVVTLAALERGRVRRAAPEWMRFALHALLYFAVLSAIFLPLDRTAKRSSHDARNLSYQILFYFGAFETFYLRLKDAGEERSSLADTYAKM